MYTLEDIVAHNPVMLTTISAVAALNTLRRPGRERERERSHP